MLGCLGFVDCFGLGVVGWVGLGWCLLVCLDVVGFEFVIGLVMLCWGVFNLYFICWWFITRCLVVCLVVVWLVVVWVVVCFGFPICYLLLC